MKEILFVGIGGFMGASLRFLVSKFFDGFSKGLPIGTLIVNVLGSFLLGFMIYRYANLSNHMKLLLTTGFMGAFTTMSTFAHESFKFAEIGQYFHFVWNLSANLILCISAVWAGRFLAFAIVSSN